MLSLFETPFCRLSRTLGRRSRIMSTSGRSWTAEGGTLTYFSLSLVYLTEDHRLSYDTAISKLEKLKTSKKDKEKERKEAEDELQTARLR